MIVKVKVPFSKTLISETVIVARSLFVIVPVPVNDIPAPLKVTLRPDAPRLLSTSDSVSLNSTLLSPVVLTVIVKVLDEPAAKSVTFEADNDV